MYIYIYIYTYTLCYIISYYIVISYYIIAYCIIVYYTIGHEDPATAGVLRLLEGPRLSAPDEVALRRARQRRSQARRGGGSSLPREVEAAGLQSYISKGI